MFRRFKISKSILLGIACFVVLTVFCSLPVFAEDLRFEINEDNYLDVNQLALARASGLPSVVYSSTFDEPVHGSLTVALDGGSLIYSPEANYNGTDAFSVRLSSGGNNATFATVRVEVTISAVNDPPAAEDVTVSCDEDSSATFSLVASDVDDAASVLLVYYDESNLAHGQVIRTPANFGFKYTPEENYFGTESFTYYVVDEDGSQSNVATVTITVNNVNDTPEILSNPPSYFELGSVDPYTYDLVASDIDGDTLTITTITIPEWATFTESGNGTGTLTGTPPLIPASYDVHFQVSDGVDLLEHNFTIWAVNLVNQAPVADAGEDIMVDEGNQVTLDGSKSYDLDGDSMTYAWSSPNSEIIISNSDQAIAEFMAPRVGAGTVNYIVDLRVSDGKETVLDQINIAVVDRVSLSANSVEVVTDEDTPIEISLSAEGQEGGRVFSIAVWPLHGSLSPADYGGTVKSTEETGQQSVRLDTGRNWIYTPHANYYGSDSFSFTATDGEGSSTGYGFVTVNSINDAPVFTSNQVESATVGAEYSYYITATDVDGDPLSITAQTVPTPTWLTLTDNGDGTATLTGTPPDADAVLVELIVSDGQASAAQSFEIIVTDTTNHPPVIESYYPERDITLLVGGSQVLAVSASDPDGDELVYFWSASVGELTASSTDPAAAIYTATTAGEHVITLVVFDQYGNRAEADWNVTVSEIVSTTPGGTDDEIADTDTEPPTISATLIGTEGNDDYYISTVTVVVATDDNERVEKIVYVTDGGDAVEIENDYAVISVSIDGSHTLSIYAQDVAGNVSETVSAAFAIDQTAPTIADISVGGVAVESGTVSLGATDSPVILASISDAVSGVSASGVTLSINGGSDLAVSVAGVNSNSETSAAAYAASYTASSAQISAGETTQIEISATDTAGNTATETFSVVTQTLAEGYASPNPADPSQNPIVFNVGLTEATQIQISVYDESARVIKSIIYSASAGNNEISWDGISFGRLIGNGLYTYRVIDLTHNQILYKGKLVVIRSR